MIYTSTLMLHPIIDNLIVRLTSYILHTEAQILILVFVCVFCYVDKLGHMNCAKKLAKTLDADTELFIYIVQKPIQI